MPNDGISRRAFGLGVAASVWSGLVASALADTRANKTADFLQNGEYNWFPERSPTGPVVIIVSVPDQMVHVYRNGIRIAASSCSTGKPGHGTPTGVFKILQKDKHHRSSTYSNAPMPNMNRLTWSGIALHAGNLPGYPASHGCVRLPLGFSELLFGITKLDMTVVIADENSQPASVVHPGMVLGNYASQEFGAVDASIKHYQYAQGRSQETSATSIVVSAKDRSISLWDNARIVATGKVDIAQPEKPIGRHVYTLTQVNEGTKELTWVSMAMSSRSKNADDNALRRVKAHPDILKKVQKAMRQGMTLVLTDESSGSSNRTADNFTIFTGEGLY
ncbi:L,D-transpeptidase-like protein [Aminobacter aminovorans]|uniref:L,D-transpeptidase catalytic domain n=1 Tax=Aminobacter aminovorans TaxID=83263 RepID=A0A380WQR6_AMIAI|nr:L,D-transpeptidase [Aminobacter aminovorans]TCS30448.1 L,D-transpeptidase-like protein [Aminobacter aminovorans]SUU91297.1 L,D-transpeptidase catalytic domain [Aminobacter aminovorans]